MAKLTILGVLVLLLLAALIQQVRYPGSAAWIVALLAAGFLLLAVLVRRLAKRNADTGGLD